QPRTAHGVGSATVPWRAPPGTVPAGVGRLTLTAFPRIPTREAHGREYAGPPSVISTWRPVRDRRVAPHQVLRRSEGGQRPFVPGRAGRDLGSDWSKWRRQDFDAALYRRDPAADRRARRHRRPRHRRRPGRGEAAARL